MFAAEEAIANSFWLYDNAWIFPAIPAASFLVILFFGKKMPFKGAEVGIAALSTAFILAVITTFAWIGDTHGEGAAEEKAQSLTADGVTSEVVLTAE